MPLSIECPECASRYKVGDHLAGKRVKCKKCGAGIHVPDSQNLDHASELPLKADEGEQPELIQPVMSKPIAPEKLSRPLGDAVIRAEAFVAAEAAAQSAFSSGVGTVVGNAPAFRPTLSPSPRPSISSAGVRPTTAAPEGVSLMLLLIFVGLMLCIGGYLATRPGASVSYVWTATISLIVSFFAIIAPMTWLGAWGASKAMRFELPSPAYMKSGAIVVTPVIMLMLISRLPPNPVLAIMCILAIPPITFLLTKLLFATTWLETLVTYLLGGIACSVGTVIALFFCGLIAYGAGLQPQSTNGAATIAGAGNAPNTYQTPTPPVDNSPPPQLFAPGPAVDPIIIQLNNFAQDARAKSTPSWMARFSKEQMTEQLNQIQQNVDSVSPQATTPDRKAKLDEVTSALTDMAGKIAQLPSEGPDPIIFQPITENTQWLPSPGDVVTPASFKRYRVEIPPDARVDLATTEDSPDGLSWEVPPRGKITFSITDRKDARQERPWIKTQAFMKSDSTSLLTLDMTNIPVEVTYGRLGNLPATRIASRTDSGNAGRFMPQRFVKYVIADGPTWIIIQCTADANDSRTLSTLENVAWSFRPARGDEPHVDPFNPDAIVARLHDRDPSQAERAEVIIRRMGAAAEPALLKHLNDSDGSLRSRVIGLLGDVGTKNAVQPLLELCSDENSHLADDAIAAVKKLSPADMDAGTEGLLKLSSKNFQTRQKAVATLALAQPKADDPRRAKISALLCDMVRDNQAGFGISDESLGDALAVWQTPSTVPSLLPMLDFNADAGRRKTAMTVLGHTRDKRAAWPIARWLIKETRDAEAALTAMGPVAEDDVLKVLDKTDQKTDVARLAACRILGEIGTQKSLKPLGYVMADRKTPADVDAANAAIMDIKARIASGGTVAPKPGASPSSTDGDKTIWVPPGRAPHQSTPGQ